MQGWVCFERWSWKVDGIDEEGSTSYRTTVSSREFDEIVRVELDDNTKCNDASQKRILHRLGSLAIPPDELCT